MRNGSRHTDVVIARWVREQQCEAADRVRRLNAAICAEPGRVDLFMTSGAAIPSLQPSMIHGED